MKLGSQSWVISDKSEICLWPRITSRNLRNKEPCHGLVKKLAIIRPVRQYCKVIFSSLNDLSSKNNDYPYVWFSEYCIIFHFVQFSSHSCYLDTKYWFWEKTLGFKEHLCPYHIRQIVTNTDYFSFSGAFCVEFLFLAFCCKNFLTKWNGSTSMAFTVMMNTVRDVNPWLHIGNTIGAQNEFKIYCST